MCIRVVITRHNRSLFQLPILTELNSQNIKTVHVEQSRGLFYTLTEELLAPRKNRISADIERTTWGLCECEKHHQDGVFQMHNRPTCSRRLTSELDAHPIV